MISRHPLPAAICAVAVALTAGFFIFARPQYRPAHQGLTIKIPDKQPAADAAGRAGWSWPDGVPGWAPGYEIGGLNVSGLQPIEAQPAQLAAAHAGLDASQLRVVVAEHGWPGEAPLAIFAAPRLETTPLTTCIGAALPRPATIEWRCPGASRPYPDVANSRIVVAAVAHQWPTQGQTRPTVGASVGFNLVGVARGDVARVVLHIPGQTKLSDSTLYERGKTWGQFESAFIVPAAAAHPVLRIYRRSRLVQTVPLGLTPGQGRIIG